MARVKHRKERGNSYAGCWFYKTADGDQVYYCSYRKDGQNITAKFGAKSKGKTLKQCSLFRAELLLGTKQTNQEKRADKKQSDSMKIDQLYSQYCSDKGRTTRQDDSLFNRWVLPYWEKKDMNACSNYDTADYLVWLEGRTTSRKGKGKPLSAQTMKHAIGLVRRIIRHTQKRIEKFNPPVLDYCIPEVNNVVTEDLDPDQLQRLVAVLNANFVDVKRANDKSYKLKINRPVADAMLLILNSGLRKGEVLKLKWFDVNFNRNAISLRQPKGGKDLVLPLSSEAIKILKRQHKTSAYVFPGKDGKQRLHIDRTARILRDAAGLPKTFRPCHGLRHYYATELVSRGAPIHVVSKLLGHKTIEVTQRYFDARTEDMKQAVEMLSIGNIQ